MITCVVLHDVILCSQCTVRLHNAPIRRLHAMFGEHSNSECVLPTSGQDSIYMDDCTAHVCDFNCRSMSTVLIGRLRFVRQPILGHR